MTPKHSLEKRGRDPNTAPPPAASLHVSDTFIRRRITRVIYRFSRTSGLEDRFVDFSRLRCAGGTGGKGSLSQLMLRRKQHMRPDGGHGGQGGSVIIVADSNEQSLKRSHPHVQAEKGTNGSSKGKLGRNGKNLIVPVPCGVVVRRIVAPEEDDLPDDIGELDMTNDDSEENGGRDVQDAFASWNVDRDTTNSQGVEFFSLDDPLDMDDNFSTTEYIFDGTEEEEEHVGRADGRERVYLADLDKPGAHVVVARGGRGGVGTLRYSSVHGPLPDARVLIENAKPEPGEVAFLELELKLIADVGLVGFPNAGK